MLPLIMLTLSSKDARDSFNDATYDTHIHLKGIPFLEARPELFMRQLKARDAVTHRPRLAASCRSGARNILQVLRDTPHNAYPVSTRKLPQTPVQAQGEGEGRGSATGWSCGATFWCCSRGRSACRREIGAGAPWAVPFEEFGKPGSGKGLRVEDIEVTEAELEMFLDLRPFVNKSHYFVGENMSLSKVFALFRSPGAAPPLRCARPQQDSRGSSLGRTCCLRPTPRDDSWTELQTSF